MGKAYPDSFGAVMRRLREALDLGDDNKALMAALKMKRSAFYNRLNSGSVPLEEVVALAKDRGISCDWLLFGVGTTDLAGKKEPLACAETDNELSAEITLALEGAFKAERLDPSQLAMPITTMVELAFGIYNEVSLLNPGAGRRAAIAAAASNTARALAVSQRHSRLVPKTRSR